MTTLLDEPSTGTAPTAAAERLRSTMAAVRLSFTWFGTRKTLTPEQKALNLLANELVLCGESSQDEL